MTMIEKLKGSSQEIRLQNTHVILTKRSEISNLAGNYEFTILRLSLREQVTVVRFLNRAILLSYWLCLMVSVELLALLHYSVSVRVVAEHALLRPIPKDFRKVMHIVCEHVILQFISRDFLRCSNK